MNRPASCQQDDTWGNNHQQQQSHQQQDMYTSSYNNKHPEDSRALQSFIQFFKAGMSIDETKLLQIDDNTTEEVIMAAARQGVGSLIALMIKAKKSPAAPSAQRPIPAGSATTCVVVAGPTAPAPPTQPKAAAMTHVTITPTTNPTTSAVDRHSSSSTTAAIKAVEPVTLSTLDFPPVDIISHTPQERQRQQHRQHHKAQQPVWACGGCTSVGCSRQPPQPADGTRCR